MIDYTNAQITEMVVHYIGNRSHEELNSISGRGVDLDDHLKEYLSAYFLDKLKSREDLYHFAHEVSLDDNLVYREIKRSFSSDAFIDVSQVICDRLSDLSANPRIAPGYVSMVRFEDIVVDDELVSGFGIFKSELISQFVQFEEDKSKQTFVVKIAEGFELGKLDKGVLVCQTGEEEGYICQVFDTKRADGEAKYWMDEFLNMRPYGNEYLHTAELMKMTKAFVTEELPENFSVPRPDQIDMLNRSADYFNSQPNYSKSEFVNNVFEDDDMQRSFGDFQSKYQEAHQMEIPDEFGLSNSAVKQQSKVFKSILKLDKNFHVYIHGDRSKIQLGREADGRKFYKIYFENER